MKNTLRDYCCSCVYRHDCSYEYDQCIYLFHHESEEHRKHNKLKKIA